MIATSWLPPAGCMEQYRESIRAAFSADVDWDEYLSLVERHRTPALSWAALKLVAELDIPEAVKAELKRRSDVCRMQAVLYSMKLTEALKSFDRAAIPVMTFKGPTLSTELYGDLGLRHSRDLDLAVAREDLRRAQACLEELGWRLDPTWFSLSPRQWQSFLAQEHSLNFAHPGAGCQLELHWRNQWDTRATTAARWARSIPSVWQGCPYRSMHPIDLVLYLCIHGGEHAWFRAKWLGDLARIYADGKVNWAAAFDEARKTGQNRGLLAALRLLEQVYGFALPRLPEDAWERLPAVLVNFPLQALEGPDPFAAHVSLTTMRHRLRMGRYERLLLPRKAWRESLAYLLYRRENFRELPLPDRLFWAYAPLHPVLWLWRWIRNASGTRA
jgi:hypothetical protein